MSLCVEKVAVVECEYASDVARCEYSRFVIQCIDFFARPLLSTISKMVLLCVCHTIVVVSCRLVEHTSACTLIAIHTHESMIRNQTVSA